MLHLKCNVYFLKVEFQVWGIFTLKPGLKQINKKGCIHLAIRMHTVQNIISNICNI